MTLIEALVGVLLVFSGIVVVIAALGLLRLPDFFLRMHPPAIAYTLGSWSVTLATIVHFTAHEQVLSLHAWLIIVLLSITAPVTTVLLARAAVFRMRTEGEPAPPPLRDSEA
ncbi:MAG: Na+/H+ antiporter subunit G [Comamonadaceae bacterium]|nr:MAG: Na+/H+ antiporter subunit G [Comamonadaceae bacterium]